MLTASRKQAAVYFVFVCLCSISLLVFVNSSISFVITSIIGQKANVGNSVGTLGFADEIVIIICCPIWGAISDRLGVRAVCTLGYTIIALSLLLFVQARNTFPQLLLARLLFSVGSAATSTMVTAILPAMVATSGKPGKIDFTSADSQATARNEIASSLSSDRPIYDCGDRTCSDRHTSSANQLPTRLAGYVGLFSGCGALLALGVFLRLPELFQRTGLEAPQSLRITYYIVGALALIFALICHIGLRRLRGEEGKGWKSLFLSRQDDRGSGSSEAASALRDLVHAIVLGFRSQVGIGYLGGFVARASSVGISLFIPLYVNVYYISSGRCNRAGRNPEDVKETCREAYVLAAELTGFSQLIALLFAPVFGYFSDEYRKFNTPLVAAALVGIIGYLGLARLNTPEAGGPKGSLWIFVIMALLGISQIGAIVSSLGLLGHYVLMSENEGDLSSYTSTRTNAGFNEYSSDESAPRERQARELAEDPVENTTSLSSPLRSREDLKGSIAGVYSLAGGTGILILTKAGGLMFDKVSPAAPFYMLASFNLLLLAAEIILVVAHAWSVRGNSK